uniref:chitinase n=1 Tax=Arcella intermedia TaxID=1963864 RepID=A0A6B2LAE4_9EUKA
MKLVVLISCFLLPLVLSHISAAPKIVMYWGQDSAGGETSLKSFCQQADYDVINLSFMISFIDTRQPTCAIPNAPDLNFANHGDLCAVWPNCPFLLNCSTTIGEDILYCQSVGKKIVLSLGGAVGSYGFTSDSQAISFASTLWGMFFEGQAQLRPFGRAILDGVDLDIEGGSTAGYSAFVKTLRDTMSKSSRPYIISGAPQCPFPDAYLGPAPGKALGDAASSFSYVSVQFYNNYCGVNSPSDFWAAFAEWHTTAASADILLMVGLPSAPSAGGGWVSADVICSMVPRLKTFSHFGGFMFWDASWDMKNNWYTKQIRACF